MDSVAHATRLSVETATMTRILTVSWSDALHAENRTITNVAKCLDAIVVMSALLRLLRHEAMSEMLFDIVRWLIRAIHVRRYCVTCRKDYGNDTASSLCCDVCRHAEGNVATASVPGEIEK